MRTSVLLTSALALFANASPQGDRAYPCKDRKTSVEKSPRGKNDCSSLLRITATPPVKTITKTVTSAKTTTKQITATAATVTHTDLSTVTWTTSTTMLTAETTTAILVPRGLPSKAAEVPEYARSKFKDKIEFLAACSAIGVKPTTTTLPAKTTTELKKLSTTITSTSVISATSTVTVSSTISEVAVATQLPPCPDCARALGASSSSFITLQQPAEGQTDYTYTLSAQGQNFALSDSSNSGFAYLIDGDEKPIA